MVSRSSLLRKALDGVFSRDCVEKRGDRGSRLVCEAIPW